MLRFITAALFSTCSLTSGAHADLFSVDIGPIMDGGHTLQVTGTIEVDLVTDAILGSDLTFFHEGTPHALPSIPTANGSGIDFVVDMGMLFIESGAVSNGNFVWTISGPPITELLFAQGPLNGNTEIQLIHIPSSFDVHSVEVNSIGRLKVGTAVPEPSAFMFSSLVGFVGVGAQRWRERRTRN